VVTISATSALPALMPLPPTAGTPRLAASVTADGKARWIAVTPGLSQGGKTQIVAPPLTPGQRIVVSGQVGLPEGSPLSLQP